MDRAAAASSTDSLSGVRIKATEMVGVPLTSLVALERKLKVISRYLPKWRSAFDPQGP